MRKLTIQRKKSLIESGSRIILYVQCDKENSTYGIGDKYFQEFPFKNGQTVEVEISNEETMVLVVSSTMRADYTVGAGDDAVNLIASPKFNPFKGNPFTIEELK